MPHKKLQKKQPPTKLLFDAEDSFLYLKVHKQCLEYLEVPIETVTVLFTLLFSGANTIKIRLVKSLENSNPTSFLIRRHSLDMDIEEVDRESLPGEVKACDLPLWHLPKQRTTVGGLCSVVRYALKFSKHTNPASGPVCQGLLGFQSGCLSAPAEVSSWTKFCEIEIPLSVETLMAKETKQLPAELIKFEGHLGQPIRMHNIRDKMQKSGKHQTFVEGNSELVLNEKGDKVDPISVFALEQHIYAEGPDLLLSDILIYPSIYLMQSLLEIGDGNKLPLLKTWFSRVGNDTEARSIMENILEPSEDITGGFSCDGPVDIPKESLYRNEAGKCKPTSRIYTRQEDVDRVVGWWVDSSIQSAQTYSGDVQDSINALDWNALPKLVHPLAGELPPERLSRKCSQLESLALATVDIAKAGDVVVDMCSGGGHLGLLLAHLLPNVTVHLVENKEESLARARARGLELGLDNVWFFQSNMEYYTGQFNIGVSLHACGVATDLVMAACLQRRAAFVCCPCCYGAVQTTDTISYPRSSLFASRGCSLQDYLVLGHVADQTMVNCEKVEQGKLCMDIVDTDRAEMAREAGYTVSLAKLRPTDCTPKNNLIIGTPK